MRDDDLISIKQRYGINGNSPLLNNAIRVAIQVAPTDMTVLISGESGTGKESFSKIIHQQSSRKHGQFIAINCGAIPEGTIDSELFGHEKGSFTGAYEARKGYFEESSSGTIFLDEIGELPISTQARLLRVLEYGEFLKVGSSKVQKANVRVVAATNIDLNKAVDDGKFREDLYYRLNTVPIFVPPLRERGEDIFLLFRKFASDFSEKYRTKLIFLTEDGKSTLLKYRFPGNIRQLKNMVEQISILEINREITSDILLKYIPRERNLIPTLYQEKNAEGISERDLLYKILFEMRKDVTDLKKLVHGISNEGNIDQEILNENKNLFDNTKEKESQADMKSPTTYLIKRASLEEKDLNYSNIEDIILESEAEESLSLEDKEKEMIQKALKKNNNKRKYAAKDLGISERTLYRKIKQFEIDE